MTVIVTGYRSVQDLRDCIGKKLYYREDSTFDVEYTSNGSFEVWRYPHVCGGGTAWAANVTMANGKIAKVY